MPQRQEVERRCNCCSEWGASAGSNGCICCFEGVQLVVREGCNWWWWQGATDPSKGATGGGGKVQLTLRRGATDPSEGVHVVVEVVVWV